MARSTIKDKRKLQLINATMDSIAKRGLTETTITHISKGANMSRGIINFYFTSKEMMMREVLATLIEEYEGEYKSALEAAKGDASAKLEAVVRAHFDKKVCTSKKLNVLSAFWGHAASHDAYREKIEASDKALLAQVADLWKDIAPKGYDAQQFARQLHALIRGLWLSYLLAPKTTDREALAKECLAFISQHAQPVRVVAEKVKVEAAKPAVSAPKPVVLPTLKPRQPKKPEAQQMDIEDLFARVVNK